MVIYAGLRFIETKKSWWIFATASFASITFLIEQSKGVGLYLGFALAFTIIRLRGKKFELSSSAVARGRNRMFVAYDSDVRLFRGSSCGSADVAGLALAAAPLHSGKSRSLWLSELV